jgi:hypothetical protein
MSECGYCMNRDPWVPGMFRGIESHDHLDRVGEVMPYNQSVVAIQSVTSIVHYARSGPTHWGSRVVEIPYKVSSMHTPTVTTHGSAISSACLSDSMSRSENPSMCMYPSLVLGPPVLPLPLAVVSTFLDGSTELLGSGARGGCGRGHVGK